MDVQLDFGLDDTRVTAAWMLGSFLVVARNEGRRLKREARSAALGEQVSSEDEAPAAAPALRTVVARPPLRAADTPWRPSPVLASAPAPRADRNSEVKVAS